MRKTSVLHERITQPATVGRICDDVFGTRPSLKQEIDSTGSMVALDEI